MLPLLAQDVLPNTTEQWAFATLVVTTVAGGIGAAFAHWTSRQNKRVDALAESQAKRIEAAERREREANERADKREETANRRMEAALQGLGQLTTITSELSSTVRQLGDRMVATDGKNTEELRRLHAGIDALQREWDRQNGRR